MAIPLTLSEDAPEPPRDPDLFPGGDDCDCCRHYIGECQRDLAPDCRRCTQCGEWCEDCDEIALLDDAGLCDACAARGEEG